MNISKKRVRANLRAVPSRSRRPWWLLAVLGAVLLIGGWVLLVWNSTQPTGPVEVAGKPKVKVDQEKIDYGDVKLGQSIETIFRVSNAGDQPLQIMGEPQVELVEGC